MREMNTSYPDLHGIDLFRQRTKNLMDAMNFKEPDKVPVGFSYLYWPYGYAGTTLEQMVNDPAANVEAYCKFMDDIEFDWTLSAGEYQAYDAYAALGSQSYVLCNDRSSIQHNQAGHNFITDEEYEVLIRDYPHFVSEYFPKRNVPALRKPRAEAYEMLKKAAICLDRNATFYDMVTRRALDHQIIPLRTFGGPLCDPAYGLRSYCPGYYAPLDSLFDKYRGMQNTFCDLIEDPDTLDRACAAIEAAAPKPNYPDCDFNEQPFPLAHHG